MVVPGLLEGDPERCGMTPVASTLRTLDVPLAGGRVLRLALHVAEDGASELLICCGWPEQREWSRIMADGTCIPGDALPALRDALAALTDG